MASSVEDRKAFVARLKRACDRNTNIPLPGEGRQQYIADRLMVTAEAVSKWFKAISMPKRAMCYALADLLGCERNWLYTGEEADLSGKERRIRAKESEGAVHLVWGLIALSGGHIGMLPLNDPRDTFVHFCATVRGTVYPMHVCLAQETAPNVYEIVVPNEFEQCRVVAVIPLGAGKFNYIDMPTPMIDATKKPKGGDYSVKIERVSSGKYASGQAQWPKIAVFGEFSEHET